jgi:LDH2 family malate/lactate/ureidoglycolate dehydrogenase
MTIERRLSPDRLLDFATAVYASAGMPEADARIVADTLVMADLWGHQSHGVMRLPWYLARLEAGEIEARSEAANRRDGLRLPRGTIEDLVKVGRRRAIETPF